MKFKIFYWLTIVVFSLLVTLNPIQAARMVPGEIPKNPPLQTIVPSDTKPNYSGSVDFKTDENLLEPSDDEVVGADDEPTIQPTSTSSSTVSLASQLWLLVGVLIASGLIAYAWYRFRLKK